MEPSVPAVTCTSCDCVWNSASMVEGLRLMGSCPRCGGSLKFADEGPESTLEQIETADAVALAPHLVMGIPRR
ncbi:MAG: hypothetical protein WKF96_09795 [Solirubrobacteraceae bacterium]